MKQKVSTIAGLKRHRGHGYSNTSDQQLQTLMEELQNGMDTNNQSTHHNDYNHAGNQPPSSTHIRFDDGGNPIINNGGGDDNLVAQNSFQAYHPTLGWVPVNRLHSSDDNIHEVKHLETGETFMTSKLRTAPKAPEAPLALSEPLESSASPVPAV